MLLISLLVLASNAKKKTKDDGQHAIPPESMKDNMKENMKAHMAEMESLGKKPDSTAKDWTIHKDVDDTFYWFSRSLKRSVRDPPAGWTKDSKGGWVAPKVIRDEL